jgi:hypothetical protein
MEDKDAVISTLQSLNLKLVKEVSKLRGEQERSKICLQNMCTYYSTDSELIWSLMEKHQAQVDTWTTHINEMEEKFTLLNEHFLADLKEKEDIIACLQKDLQQSLASNVAFALLTTTELPSPNFELHTRGFGSKLMHQMGYTSGGLGKNGQGIVHPIQPVMRPAKVGLGFVGTSLPVASCLDISVVQTQFVPAQESITQDDSSTVELQQPPPTPLIDTTLELSQPDSTPTSALELSSIRLFSTNIRVFSSNKLFSVNFKVYILHLSTSSTS